MFLNLINVVVIIKGKRCADGRNQLNWLSKYSILLPTVSAEGLIISRMIDAMEVQYVATADIPGSFLKRITTKET